MAVFAENVRACREAAGLSVTQLARRVGVHEHTVYSWEAGRITAPRERTLRELAFALGVTPERLLGASPEASCCDVWRISLRRVCRVTPAFPFAASCACGHDMAGLACEACLGSLSPGCLTCWQDKQHRCPVTVTAVKAVSA